MNEHVIRAYDALANQPVEMVLHEGQLRDCRPIDSTNETTTPADLPYVGPGFFDLQVNGYQGRDFTSPQLTVDDVYAVADALWRFGTTRFLPTVITQAHEVLIHCVRTIAQAVNEFPILKQRIPGIHLEGPYISTQDGPRGAHPREQVRPPNWDEFCRLQEAATGLIRLVTLSPEYETSLPFIEKASKEGITVAIGHTAASPEQIRSAVAAGARLSTHLGNGCHLTLPRHPNYLWEQLAADDLYASFIADGFHLPAAFLKVALRAKRDRAVLVSDLSAMAGLPPGRYSTPLCELEILETGQLVVAGQRALLAGAAEPITTGIVNAMVLGGATLRQAVAMATITPCEVLKIEPPQSLPGTPANLVVFEIEQDNEQFASSDKPDLLPARKQKLAVRQVHFHGEVKTFG